MATEEELQQWRQEGFDAVITCSDEEPAHGTFRGVHELYFDEPEYIDVGSDEHPCPHDYLIAAVGGCQVEILKQCLEKSRIDQYDITADIQSEKGRESVDEEIPQTADIRITDIRTEITLTVPSEFDDSARRCIDVFEENCPISQSVQAGIDLRTSATLNSDTE